MDNRSVIHPAIKLRHIRTFLDIAQDGALSQVARRQGISQPALSRSLAELETLLGQQLFLRQSRRLVLTEAGKIFRRHAGNALEALNSAAVALRPNGSATLRIGTLPTAASTFMPKLILRFIEIHPNITLEVETGPHHHLIRMLREGRLDMMIGRLPNVSDLPGLSFEHLYEEDVILVGRYDHPLQAHALPDILTQVPLILPPPTAIIRRPVDEFLASLGLAGVQASVQTASLAVGRAICAQSNALWFISRGVVSQELALQQLREFPIKALFLFGAVGITRRPESQAPGLSTAEEIARDLTNLSAV